MDMINSEDTPWKDVMGRWRIPSLFYELSYGELQEKFTSPYTLKENDLEVNGVLYKSLKKLYLEMEDVTEYEFANAYLGGWQHWKAIKASSACREYVEAWQEELQLKLRARGISKMLETVTDGTAGFQALKWLVDKGFVEQQAGRPKKKDIERKTKQDAELRSIFSADLKRVK
jgi:hypothetical protein